MAKLPLNDYEINNLHRMFNRMLASIEKMNTKQQKENLNTFYLFDVVRERLHLVRVSVLQYNDIMCLKDKYLGGLIS